LSCSAQEHGSITPLVTFENFLPDWYAFSAAGLQPFLRDPIGSLWDNDGTAAPEDRAGERS
jgi:hypothetical protein